MTIDEMFAPVKHVHGDCPICTNAPLIEDIGHVRTDWDKLMVKIRDANARVRIMLGKRIEVKEVE